MSIPSHRSYLSTWLLFRHLTDSVLQTLQSTLKSFINTEHKLKCLLIIPLIVDKAAIAYLIIQSHLGKNMNLVNVALQYSKTIIPKNALQTFKPWLFILTNEIEFNLTKEMKTFPKTHQGNEQIEHSQTGNFQLLWFQN